MRAKFSKKLPGTNSIQISIPFLHFFPCQICLFLKTDSNLIYYTINLFYIEHHFFISQFLKAKKKKDLKLLSCKVLNFIQNLPKLYLASKCFKLNSGFYLPYDYCNSEFISVEHSFLYRFKLGKLSFL